VDLARGTVSGDLRGSTFGLASVWGQDDIIDLTKLLFDDVGPVELGP